MNPKLKEKLLESLMAVLPITLIVLALSVALVPMDVGTAVMFTVGAVLLVFGMGLFQLGAEMAMTPLGEGIGVQMERVKKIPLIVAIAFVMGVIITIAEPDLQVLAQQVPSIPNKVLIYSVAVGVGAFLALAVVRILKRISLSKLLVVLYGLLAAVSIFAAVIDRDEGIERVRATLEKAVVGLVVLEAAVLAAFVISMQGAGADEARA